MIGPVLDTFVDEVNGGAYHVVHSIDVCLVFEKVNTGGVPLSVF